MALQTAAIITSIAGYSVSGVTILDADAVKDEVDGRDTPLLMLSPDFFLSPTFSYDTYGTGAVAQITAMYTLRWRFFYAEAGKNRGLRDIFQGFIQSTTAIIDAIIANDATNDAIHLQVVGNPAFNVVPDPTGNIFHGTDLDIRVTEFIN